jgi:exosortase
MLEGVFVHMRSRAAAWAAFLAATAIVYWPILATLVGQWWSDPEYSHGLLCAPAAVALVFMRRRELRAAPAAPRMIGLVGAVAAVGLLGLGVLGAELFLTRISLALFLASSVVFLYGWRRLRVLAFPFALLLLSIPIPAIVITRVTLPLQLAASAMSESTLMAIHIPVLREGNVLVLPNATLQVAEACSGIRSLVSLVVMALVIGRMVDRRATIRAAIVAAAVPVAVLVNGLRVTLTAAATYSYGAAAAAGVAHEILGVITFVVALALLLGCARLLHGARIRPAMEVTR